MIGYLFYDVAGEIKSHAICSLEEAQNTANSFGLSFIESEPAHPAEYWVKDGVLTAKIPTGPAPTEFQELEEPTLQAVQDRRWDDIKKQRDFIESSGLTTPYGVFDSDIDSQMNLITQSNFAQSQGSDWSINWTLKDNSSVTLNKDQIKEVTDILFTEKNNLHQQSQRIRALIYSPDATIESVNNITWNNGNI